MFDDRFNQRKITKMIIAEFRAIAKSLAILVSIISIEVS